jgi:tRNA1(Val) A37 N6-methylase TrmN6
MASRYVLIAEENAKRNNLADRIKVLKGDMLDSMRHDQPDWPAAGSFAHAYANPPFFDDNTVQHPADTLRAQAHLLKAGELDAWVKLMTGMVRQRGTVTVIHPATSLHSLLAAMVPRLGALIVLPLRAHAASEASRIIVRGVKGSKGPLKLLPGLVLHRDGSNAFVPEVDVILRAGEALELS